MNARFIWLGLMWTVACESQKAVIVSDGVGEGMSLAVIPESSEATAGDDLGLQVVWVASDGSQTAAAEFTLVSSIEPDVSHDDDSVVVTVAGDHELTALAIDAAGMEQSATAAVLVEPGATAALAMSLSVDSTVAGVPIEATVSAEDAYGNATSAGEAELSADDDVTVDGATLVSTIAGSYVARAELGDLQAEAPFVVTAGMPVAVDLVIEASSAELGDELTYSIAVTDEYGNASDEEPVLSAPDGVVVDADTLTFDAEGVFEFVATAADESLADSETVIVDSSGPDLIVSEPERGAWTDTPSVTVAGTATDAVSDVDGVTINGESIDLADDGSFEHTAGLNFGVNILETSALDTDGSGADEANGSTDIRSVLFSDAWVDPGAYRADALMLRMSEGPGGLDQLSALAPVLMESVDLDSLLGGELYADEVPILGSTYPISITATGVSYGDVVLAIDATADGYLDMRMTINDLRMEFVSTGSLPWLVVWLAGLTLPGDGAVAIDAMHVDLMARPAIVDGTLSFDDLVVTVPDPEGLTIEDESGLLALGSAVTDDLDAETLIVDEMRAAVEAAIGDGGDGLLDGVLGDFGVEESFEVSGMTYTLMAELGSVDVDDGGMTLGMETRVVPDEVLSIGALDGPTEIPVFDWLAPDLSAGDAPLQMALSTDVLNQVMFAMWQGGLLDQALASEDLGLDPTLLAVVLPSVEAVNIVTTPHLPPVFTPKDVTETEEGDQFDLTIGSMEVVLYDGDPAGDERVMTLFVAMKVPMQLAATEGAIEMDLGEAEVWIDPTYVDPDLGLTAETIATLFSPILASFVPELTGDLTSIPFPSLDGFSIAIDGSGMGGGDAPPGFWVADGALE